MSNIETTTGPKHASGAKRVRRAVPLVTAATISASLVAAAAGPASAAVQDPAHSAGETVSAAAVVAASHYVHVTNGHVAIDTAGARRAGISTQALSAETTVLAGVNQLLAHGPAAATGVRTANLATPLAAGQGTTIQLLPGITLTVDGNGIRLNMTRQAVAEVEGVAGFGQTVAGLVGAVLAATGVPLGAQIAGVVAAGLGVGNALLRICTAPDGSATFTVPWLGIPSCSGLTLF